MKARFRISLMFAALAGLAAMGSGRTAEAGLRLTITVDNVSTGEIKEEDVAANGGTLAVAGGTATLEFDPDLGTFLSWNGTLNGMNFTRSGAYGFSNEPGTPYYGYVNLNSGTISTSSPGNKVFSIVASADQFQEPVTPPTITQNLSMSITMGGRGSIANAQATGSLTDTSSNSYTLESSEITVATNQSGLSDKNQGVPSLAAPYIFTTSFTGRLNGSSAGASLTSLGVTHTLTKPVREPSTLAVAGLGILLSVGVLRRRNRSRA